MFFSTCKFAQRVSQIKNIAIINQEMDPTLGLFLCLLKWEMDWMIDLEFLEFLFIISSFLSYFVKYFLESSQFLSFSCLFLLIVIQKLKNQILDLKSEISFLKGGEGENEEEESGFES